MILVTGGAGYIGSHAVKALRKAAVEPVIFDNFSTGHRSFVRGTPCVEGDVRNMEDLRSAFRQYRIEGVIHFAGKAYVGESCDNPSSYFDVNLRGGLNLLDAMNEFSVRQLIFSSTCATYGVPDRVPIDEDHPQRPINPYGDTKLAFERAMLWYGRAYGLKSFALRYFNAAGADPDGEFGEDHDPETHLIPLTLRAAAGRLPSVHVLGTDYPTPDGTCLRDYIHVSDLAEAHVLALSRLPASPEAFSALNLGTGTAYSVRQVIDSVRRITGRDFQVVESPRRPGDPPHLVADPSRAHKVLGWSPRFSGLDTIVRTAWSWMSRA